MAGLRKTFAYHKPSPEGIAKIARIRRLFSELLDELDKELPDKPSPQPDFAISHSREKALAVTNLEQSCMWATKAVTHNDPNSVIES